MKQDLSRLFLSLPTDLLFQSSPTYPKAPPVFPSPSLLYRTMTSLPLSIPEIYSPIRFISVPFIPLHQMDSTSLLQILAHFPPALSASLYKNECSTLRLTWLPALSLPSQLIASVPRLLHFEQSVSLSLTPAVAFSNFYMNRPWKFLFVSRK